MIPALRRRLAALFGGLTSLVLLVMLAVTCYLNCTQYRSSQEVLYQNRFQTLLQQLQRGGEISDSYLSQVAGDETLLCYVEVNGIALHFSALRSDELNEGGLLAALRSETARQQAVQEDASLVSFALSAEGADYEVTVCTMADYQVYFAQDLTSRSDHIRELVGLYLLLGAAGVSAMLLVSWLLSRIATRPTERAVEEQRAFIAAASHELRSPLAVVRASLYAAGQQSDQPAVQNQLALADQEAERMSRLVGDLLTLTGSGVGRWACKSAPVELETVCVRLYDLFAPQAEQKGHPFRLELPEEVLPVLQSDEQRLVQLLSALLSNAMDHTPAETEVALRARVEGGCAVLSVIDHGPGIPDGEKAAVFRRFYRSERSRTDKGHFGLGLSIAQELARQLGGQLTLEDTPGGGAAFSVRLRLPHGRWG
ncbi:MAG: HAMP domain-containing histidine kinase [Clostridiales bacterium]|nr:HAMP domain-containing histidine kinase [Clostridiales bacterium]MCD8366774.1 HAMP domain-containing histidine kinase [Clostridiales bacterium]